MPIFHWMSEQTETAFLFIHIPKTGGTAIEDYFRTIGLTSFYDPPSYRLIRPVLRVPPAHFDYETCDRLFYLDLVYSFAVVRNPIDRMISEYKWAMQQSNLPNNIKKFSFSEFLQYALPRFKRDENFLAGHLKPQSRFVGTKVSRIFKYEDGLDHVVSEVLNDVGFRNIGSISIPVVNASASMSVTISDGDMDALSEVYLDDFKRFGYKPETSSREMPQ